MTTERRQAESTFLLLGTSWAELLHPTFLMVNLYPPLLGLGEWGGPKASEDWGGKTLCAGQSQCLPARTSQETGNAPSLCSSPPAPQSLQRDHCKSLATWDLWGLCGQGSGQSFLLPPTPDTTNSSGEGSVALGSLCLFCMHTRAHQVPPIGYLQPLPVQVQTGHNPVSSPGLQTAFSD